MSAGACRQCVKHEEDHEDGRDVVCGIPECGNQRLDDFGREVEPIDDDDGKNLLDVVHEPGEHADDGGPDEEERRIDLDLAYERSGGLVLPDDVEVRFQATEREDERDKKTACADKP